jgi:hypothetical protein
MLYTVIRAMIEVARAMSTARHGIARHGTARHGTARHGTARQCRVTVWETMFQVQDTAGQPSPAMNADKRSLFNSQSVKRYMAPKAGCDAKTAMLRGSHPVLEWLAPSPPWLPIDFIFLRKKHVRDALPWCSLRSILTPSSLSEDFKHSNTSSYFIWFAPYQWDY